MLELKVSYAVEEDGLVQERFTPNGMARTEKMELEELAAIMKNLLIKVAKSALKEEQDKGFDKNPLVIIDKKLNKKEEDVSPFGEIVYTNRLESLEFVKDIYKMLVSKSRVDTGLYRDNHLVLFKGQTVASNVSQLEEWIKSNPVFNVGDRIRFVNAMPYASKLEREGISATRTKARLTKGHDKRQRSGSQVRQPNGTYFLTYKTASKLLGGAAKIKFEWINGKNLGLTGAPTRNRMGKPLRYTFAPTSKRKGYYTHPCLVIDILGANRK